MASTDLFLIDTCIWVTYFNRPRSAEKVAIDGLLDDDRAALIGPILAEVLLGFRRDQQADWVASELRGLNYIDTDWDDWRKAARLGRRMIANGNSLPLSDLIIAAVALDGGHEVYSSDPHFDLFPDLKRFIP